MRLVVLLSAGALLQSSQVFAAREPATLQPSSPWQMSYDDQGCRLSRSFGAGDQTVIAHFSRYSVDEKLDVVVTSKLLTPTGAHLKIRFTPGEEPYAVETALFGKSKEGTTWQFNTSFVPRVEVKKHFKQHPWGSRQSLRPREQARLAEITHFELVGGVQTPVKLSLGSLIEPMKAMESCIDDLMTSWGFVPAEQRTLKTEPVPKSSPAKWIRPNDYPTDALRKGLSGNVEFRLDVSAEGQATRCTILNSLSDPVFKAKTCEVLMAHAKFEPAISSTGKSIASFWGTTVVFAAP